MICGERFLKMNGLQPGAHASVSRTVDTADLASTIASEPADTFPDVLATARMVALMEIAAARVMRPHLHAGETSVGVTVEITHAAPTPPGATVRAHARFVGREGKLYVFEVSAEDDGGEIGRGMHKRAAVQVARLVARAEDRIDRAADS